MTDERRENNEKIIFFMGEVTQHMKNDKTWKEDFKKSNTGNRLTKVETNQKWILRIGSVFTVAGLSVIGRGIYKHFW